MNMDFNMINESLILSLPYEVENKIRLKEKGVFVCPLCGKLTHIKDAKHILAEDHRTFAGGRDVTDGVELLYNVTNYNFRICKDCWQKETNIGIGKYALLIYIPCALFIYFLFYLYYFYADFLGATTLFGDLDHRDTGVFIFTSILLCIPLILFGFFMSPQCLKFINLYTLQNFRFRNKYLYAEEGNAIAPLDEKDD